MQPGNHVSSSKDVDNEATTELPVLDLAAYESTLTDGVSQTDTWVLPNSMAVPVAIEATVQLPTLSPVETIPTLQAIDLEATREFNVMESSATLELPALPINAAKPAKANKPHKQAAPRPAVVVSQPRMGLPPIEEPPAMLPVASSIVVPMGQPVPPPPPIIEELRIALAGAERRIEELNERARIADTERGVAIARANAECAQLREQMSVHLESVHTAKARLSVRNADLPSLEDELFQRADRIADLERKADERARELARQTAALADNQQRVQALESEQLALRASIARRDAQIGMLEADNSARQQREADIRQRLELALSASNADVPLLRQEIATRAEQLRMQALETQHAVNRAREQEDDLRVAEENIRRLEVDVRDKGLSLEELTNTINEWRAVIAESQRSILERDSRIQKLEADLDKRAAASAAADSLAQTGEEVALEGPARVLIRTDGNTDFVHVLGRRTRIGRGNDNELVLDTKHISRYHAVLLAGPVHTSIEDLNSTNGVFVNNKRVSRQVLKDGDRVTVGRTQFRYSVRG